MGKWSQEARREFYTRRYGEEEGTRRYQEWISGEGGTNADTPLGSDQELPPIRPRSTERAPQRRRGKLGKGEVDKTLDTALGFANKGLILLYPPWEDDQLTYEERGKLADALADEILQSDKLTQWYLKYTQAGRHGKLIFVLASIALPRMIKHGMIPGIPGGSDGEGDSSEQPYSDPIPMERGAAYGSDRNDRQWEVSPDSQTARPSPVVHSSEVQSGQDEIPESENGSVIFGHGRSSGIPNYPPAHIPETR